MTHQKFFSKGMLINQGILLSNLEKTDILEERKRSIRTKQQKKMLKVKSINGACITSEQQRQP
jgi:hypothetical protein